MADHADEQGEGSDCDRPASPLPSAEEKSNGEVCVGNMNDGVLSMPLNVPAGDLASSPQPVPHKPVSEDGGGSEDLCAEGVRVGGDTASGDAPTVKENVEVEEEDDTQYKSNRRQRGVASESSSEEEEGEEDWHSTEQGNTHTYTHTHIVLLVIQH